MSEPESPREGVAEAITDLSEQTRNLVRTEVGAARREMWDKAKESAPGLGLAGVSLGLGMCAAASAYRLSLRALEAMTSPGIAAFLASAGYGGAAVFAGLAAARRLRDLPAPFPTDTARHGRPEPPPRTSPGHEK